MRGGVPGHDRHLPRAPPVTARIPGDLRHRPRRRYRGRDRAGRPRYRIHRRGVPGRPGHRAGRPAARHRALGQRPLRGHRADPPRAGRHHRRRKRPAPHDRRPVPRRSRAGRDHRSARPRLPEPAPRGRPVLAPLPARPRRHARDTAARRADTPRLDAHPADRASPARGGLGRDQRGRPGKTRTRTAAAGRRAAHRGRRPAGYQLPARCADRLPARAPGHPGDDQLLRASAPAAAQLLPAAQHRRHHAPHRLRRNAPRTAHRPDPDQHPRPYDDRPLPGRHRRRQLGRRADRPGRHRRAGSLAGHQPAAGP